MVEKSFPWWRKALNRALDGIRSAFGLFQRPPKPLPLNEDSFSERTEEILEVEPALTHRSPHPEPVTPQAVAAVEAAPQVVAEEDGVPASSAVPEPEMSAEPEPAQTPAFDPLPAAGEVAATVLPELSPDPAGQGDPAVEPAALAPQPAPAAADGLEESGQEAEEPVVDSAPEARQDAAAPEVPALDDCAPEDPSEPAALTQDEAPTPPEAAEEPTPEADAPVEPPLASPAQPTPVEEPPQANLLSAQDAVAAPTVLAAAEPAAPPLLPAVPDEKAAARLAAKQKRRQEQDEDSPFSVMVDHVYDGPLDLLLDLIRSQDIDIYDIPIAKITAQFLAYVNQLRAGDMDVAGEFIYTASLLIHIKSKMLLPRAPAGPDEAPEDPRRELVERLLEHERFKNAAQMLQQKQMLEAATWSNPGLREFQDDEAAEPEIAADTVDLVRIFRDILERARNRPVIDVEEDSVTVGQMIQFLARRLTMEDKPVALRRLLSHTRSERALVAMFLALLELVRLQAVLLRQDRHFSEIFIKKHTAFDSVMNEGLVAARDDWR
jgi:segregation and condensation protein A